MSACRACLGSSTAPFYELAEVPVHSNRIYHERAAATAGRRAPLRLVVCSDCGFIQNDAYDPSLHDYRESYEDSQAHSGRFEEFARELVDDLIRAHELRDKHILEIGCGRGEFLLRLCRSGGCRGTGFDPAFRPSPESAAAAGVVEFRDELYGPEQAGLETDFVFFRHTLEHIEEVRSFLMQLRQNLGSQRSIPIYVEVPDTERILRERAFWDVYFEHCSYFTRDSLSRVLRASGFAVDRARLGYGDQYVMLDGRTAQQPERTPPSDEPRRTAEAAQSFGTAVRQALADWERRLARWHAERRRVALWGSGSKAVGFLTAVSGSAEVCAVVDINPAKQGSYQAGTGHPIVAPSSLRDLRPDVIVMMNGIYRAEIAAQLEGLGVQAELLEL